MRPVPFYKKYFLSSNKSLFGVASNSVEPIKIYSEDEKIKYKILDFFKKNDFLYFELMEIKEKKNKEKENIISKDVVFFKQQIQKKLEDDSELKEKKYVEQIRDLPKKPALSRSTMEDNDFIIKNYKYNEILCSDIQNIKIKSGIERFLNVEGHLKTSEGLFFNVIDGRGGVKTPGLYFWPINRSAIHKISEPGTFY